MGVVDLGFVLAVVGLGWGLSLATYRSAATRWSWPMGTWQQQRHPLPVMIGVAAVGVAIFYAFARGWGGYVLSASLIPVFGIAWAAFWTGFLRVGAQSALLLAPLAAVMLLVRWLG